MRPPLVTVGPASDGDRLDEAARRLAGGERVCLWDPDPEALAAAVTQLAAPPSGRLVTWVGTPADAPFVAFVQELGPDS